MRHIVVAFFLIFVRQSRFTPETVERSDGERSNKAGDSGGKGQKIDSIGAYTTPLKYFDFIFRNCYYSKSYISTLIIYRSRNNIWGYDKLLILPPWRITQTAALQLQRTPDSCLRRLRSRRAEWCPSHATVSLASGR